MVTQQRPKHISSKYLDLSKRKLISKINVRTSVFPWYGSNIPWCWLNDMFAVVNQALGCHTFQPRQRSLHQQFPWVNDLNDLSHAITPIYVTPTRNGRVSISCNFESTKYWFSLCPKLGHSPTVTRISTKFSGIEALVICLWGKWFKNIPETKEDWCLFYDHLIRNSLTAMQKKKKKKKIAVFHSQCSWN